MNYFARVGAGFKINPGPLCWLGNGILSETEFGGMFCLPRNSATVLSAATYLKLVCFAQDEAFQHRFI